MWWFEREFEARGKELSKELVERGIAEVSDGATIVTFLPQLFPRFLQFHRRLVELGAPYGRLREVPAILFNRVLISLIAGYLLTERIARPAETLNLPDVDWVRGLVDIFMYGVLRPVEPQR